MPGKRYDRQFKLAAARVILEGETLVKELADEMGLKDNTLRRWAAEYEKGTSSSQRVSKG